MLSISNTIRNKMYDQTVPQRLVFLSDDGYGNYVVIGNEDISVNGGVDFNLEGINTQLPMFGCTPMSQISIKVCNHYMNGARRYRANDIGNRTFAAYFGVQTSDNNTIYTPYYTHGAEVIASCRKDDMRIYVLSTGEVIGNVKFGSMIAQVNTIADVKIAITLDTIYLRYDYTNDLRSHYKIRKVSDGVYGDMELADVSAITYLNLIENYSTITYGKNRMEIGYALETVSSEHETWGDVKSGTWNDVKDGIWGDYSGYKKYRAESYYTIPFGIWNTDMPRHTTDDMITITAHDNMCKFDVDSAGFTRYILNIRPSGKMTCKELVYYLCQYCKVDTGALGNFSYMGGGGEVAAANIIDARTYDDNKSCKDLLSYALEVGATNGLIDRWGRLKTYHSFGSGETSDAEELPYIYTADVADYVTPIINKVLVSSEGKYKSYSSSGQGTVENVYEWTDNPYFNRVTSTWWTGSDNISLLSNYRDAVVTTCANYALWTDDVYTMVFDEESLTEPIFTLSITWNAHGVVTYSNYGIAQREAPDYDQREAGIINSNVKTVNGNSYIISVGDNESIDGIQLNMASSAILLGNTVSQNNPNYKQFLLFNDQWMIMNKVGMISCYQDSLRFNQLNGSYVFEDIQTSASSANMYIDSDTGKIYRVTSLLRNKSNVQTIDNAWEKVDTLRGVSYNSNCDYDDPTKTMYGFIAEEVADKVPELAEYSNNELASVQYDRFTALLLEDCKESHKRIRELEKRLEEIERRLL